MWKVQLRAGSGENEKWFQIQDLIVEEIRKEMIFLGETVIQVPISSHDHPTVADYSLSRSGNASNPQRKVERDGSVQTMYFFYAFKTHIPSRMFAVEWRPLFSPLLLANWKPPVRPVFLW